MSDQAELLSMTTDIVTAMVSYNAVEAEALPELIRSVHDALATLGEEPKVEDVDEKPSPAVTVRKSLADPAVIISMIDGKPYRTLKRHLATHGYTPESYRQTFDLRKDYPMVAPAYSEQRREVAHRLGLGRRPAAAEPAPAAAPQPEPTKSAGRRRTLKAAFGKGEPAKAG